MAIITKMADLQEGEVPSILLPCLSCNRTFRPEALAKHSKVCEKTLMKKRKQFDSSKQRIQGTELAEFLPILPTFTKKVDKSPVRKPQAPVNNVNAASASKISLSSPKTKWREKHNELVQTIKAARLPPGQAPSTPIKPSDQEQCPYCERTFGPKAYDRHLEWCKEQRIRIQPKSPASQRAKERLEARTKYRAPLTTKCKQRSVSRDKLDRPPGKREPSPSPQQHPIPPLTPHAARRKLAKTAVLESMSAPNLNQSFTKGTPLRSSTRSVSSFKKTSQSNKIGRFPCPNSSLKLKMDEMNEQVPEISISEPSSKGLSMTSTLDFEMNMSDTIKSQLVNIYEINIPVNFVETSTPHYFENKAMKNDDMSKHSAQLTSSNTQCDELKNHELNKTYTKQDLKDLIECSSVTNRAVEVKKKVNNKTINIFTTSDNENLIQLTTKNTENQRNSYQNFPQNSSLKVVLPKESHAKESSYLQKTYCDISPGNTTFNIDMIGTITNLKCPQQTNFLPKKSDIHLTCLSEASQPTFLVVFVEYDSNDINYHPLETVMASMIIRPNVLSLVPEITSDFLFLNRINLKLKQQLIQYLFVDFKERNDISVNKNTFSMLSYKDASKFTLVNKNNYFVQPNLDTEFKKDPLVLLFSENMFENTSGCSVFNCNESVEDNLNMLPIATSDFLNPPLAKKRKYSISPRSTVSGNAMLSEYDSGTYWDYYDTGEIIRTSKLNINNSSLSSPGSSNESKRNSTCSSEYIDYYEENDELLIQSTPNKNQQRIRTFKFGESSVCEIEKSTLKFNDCHLKNESELTKNYKKSSESACLQSIYRVSNYAETYRPESLPYLMVSKKLTVSPISQINPGYKIESPSKLPQLNYQKITLAKSASNINLVPKNKMASLESPGEKMCNTSECFNFSKTQNYSKLPVIKHIPAQNNQQGRAKDIHWSDTFIKRKEKQRKDKEVASHLNVKSSAQFISKSKKSERMYNSLKAFTAAEISKNTDILNLKKSRKLSPIASKSVSMSSSANSQSSSESYFDSFNEMVVDFTDDTVAIDFSNMQKRNKKKRRTYSDSVELCTYRVRDPPLQSHLKQQCHHPDHYLQPIVPWMEVHYFNNRKTKNQRLRFPNAVKKVVTQITKKRSKEERELYDPYKSAERQMMELLEPEKDPPKLAPLSMSPAPNLTIQSSPTSAFSKFLPLSSPEYLCISEDDNCNRPSKDETKSIHSSEKSDSPLTICYDNYSSSKDSNQNPISLSTLSLCSTISIESIDGNRNSIRSGYSSSAKVPEKKTPVPLRRTVSAYESRRGRDKGKLKMEDMLYGSSSSERERYLGSPIITDLDKDIDNHSSSNSLFKSVMDEETLNAEQELLKSMSEFEKLLSSSSSPSPLSSSPPFKLFPSLVSSSHPETDDTDHLQDFDLHAAIQSIGPDSAYSSLNRKSPVGGEHEKECSSLENTAVARFCHECGAKYPVLAAKFCCQCGVRRLVI